MLSRPENEIVNQVVALLCSLNSILLEL